MHSRTEGPAPQQGPTTESEIGESVSSTAFYQNFNAVPSFLRRRPRRRTPGSRPRSQCFPTKTDGFINRLPDRYDHELHERGATLSQGQRQLLSFARAVAFEPRIFVLDEATANIDTETEVLIQQAIDNLMKGRTAIVIAHRLSTVRNVDRILVLNHGRIVEEGSHQQLLRKRGLYYKLYQLQYKDQATNN